MTTAAYRGLSAALCTTIACLCVLSGAAAGRAMPGRVRTEFGFVRVHPRDVDAATGEGRAAREAAARALLLRDVRFAIVEEGLGRDRWGGRVDGYVVYPWAFPHGAREFDERPAVQVLRHEIGHDLFARLVPRSTVNQYGTDAPDWLDEMAAIAFEGAASQADRRRAARREANDANLIPLSTLLVMVHPEFRPEPSANAGQVIVSAAPTSGDTIRFYSTIQAFYDFLRARSGNDAIVSELASAFRRGDDLGSWILDRLPHTDRSPSLETLDAEFRHWIVEDPRYAA